MLAAQHAAALGTGAAGDEGEANAADVTVGRQFRLREDANLATHVAPRSWRSITCGVLSGLSRVRFPWACTRERPHDDRRTTALSGLGELRRRLAAVIHLDGDDLVR